MSYQLEQYILSVLLRHPGEIARVNLTPDDFEEPFFGLVFSGMRGAIATGGATDLLSIAERTGNPDALNILVTLHQQVGGTVSALPEWTDKLRKEGRARKLSDLLSSAAQAVQAGKDCDKVASRLLERLSGLAGDERKNSYTAKDVAIQLVEYLEELHAAHAAGGLVGVPTGIEPLDGLLGGFNRSDLVILAARPKMGKTAAMMTFARNAALAGRKVGIASAEMPAVQLGLRLAAMVANISASDMRSCRMTSYDYTRLSNATETIAALPIQIYDKPGCSPGDIALQARAWQLSGGLDLLFVDYLTRLVPDAREEARTREVGEMVKSLKTLAKTLNIPVICLAQLSRECEKRADKRPLLSDLRDSGEIEQEADSVIFLYRDTVYNEQADPEDAEIIVEANRHGQPGTVRARFLADQMLWVAK